MSRRRRRALLAAVGLPLAAAAAPVPVLDLALPLPVELPVTASFGEFRAGHLHAGLDFSTRGELGWPVRAAADGTIYRVKVEPRGYGRAIYVRHRDGFETVYGHLHAFEDERLGLERFVAAERRRRGVRYPGDLYPDPALPVQRGQIIALSGEKGSGPPHLHLELRHRGAPVDPVRYGGLEPRGMAAPVFEELVIVPRGPCRVDGRPAPAVLPFSRGRGGFRVAATPTVEGSCDLVVRAKVPGGGNMGLGALDADCGEGTFLRAELHRFTFDQHRQVGLVYDAARSSSSGRFYYRLRPGDGLDLPGIAAAGLGEPRRGRLACTLRARDAGGRETRGTFALDMGPALPYASSLPAEVRSFELFERLLLVNGDIALDPLALPPGAAGIAGMPALLRPADAGRSLEAGGIRATLPARSFFGPLPVALAVDSGAPAPAAGLRALSAAVRVAPDGLILREDARLSAHVEDAAGAAFYRLDRDGSAWSHVGGVTTEGRLEVGTRRGGTFMVLRDESAPRITGVHLRREPRLGARRLVFPVEDVGSGLDWDGFQAWIDGRPADAEFDPDRDWGEVWVPGGLRGRRRVEARCRDRAGNESAAFQATVTL